MALYDIAVVVPVNFVMFTVSAILAGALFYDVSMFFTGGGNGALSKQTLNKLIKLLCYAEVLGLFKKYCSLYLTCWSISL